MSKIDAIASRQRDWRTRAKSEIAIGWRSWRAARWRICVSPLPCHVEPSTTRRFAIAKTSSACSVPKGGSSGHQSVTGRSWMSSGATIASRCRPGLAADGQIDRLGAGRRGVLAGQHAVGVDLGVEPRRAVGIGGRDDERPRGVAPGQVLDRRSAALADLRPAGDDDEVHHARAGGDVAFGGDVASV